MNVSCTQAVDSRGKPPINDYFETAITNLRSNCARLYGGYYEPASERDVLLAEGIAELLIKFKRHPFRDKNLC